MRGLFSRRRLPQVSGVFHSHRRAVFDGKLTDATLRTYLALAANADENGEVSVSLEVLSGWTGRQPSVLLRHIKELVATFYLLRERRKDEDGGQLANRYFITSHADRAL